MRFLIRWGIRIFLLLLAVVVAAILLLDTFTREMVEKRMRAATGMETRLGGAHVGLLTPEITLVNLRLYNTPAFGGSIFIDMPELHLEYDPQALRKNDFHFKLVRLNLAEISIIQDKKGRLNIQSFAEKHKSASKKSGGLSGQTNFCIDNFNLSLGKLRMMNLGTGYGRETDLNFKNQIYHNVRSAADLAALGVISGAKSGALESTNSPIDLSAVLRDFIGF